MELYVHFPFCKQKCTYCDFASFAGQEAQMEVYVDALISEAVARVPECSESITTVYLGGGTPSLLTAHLLRKLFTGLSFHLPMEHVIEFTMEANPGTLNRAWLEAAMEAGMNRLSMGMQAYQNDLLALLGRIHRFGEVSSSLAMAREAGLENISLDLMFGIPTQTLSQWQETMDAALRLEPSHISTYGLIPEEGTPLYARLQDHTLELPAPEEERAMYEETLQTLASHHFVQYEISNFSIPGKQCRHNIGYWRQTPYLGLGVSAASMLDVRISDKGMRYTRAQNPNTLEAYFAGVRQHPGSLGEKTRIEPAEARFETMMLGLRMNEGVCETDFLQMHKMTPLQAFGEKLERSVRNGLLEKKGNWWRLTRRGMDFQNQVLVELMD